MSCVCPSTAARPKRHLKVRGIPAFERVVANVAEMVRTQRELGSSTPRLSLWVTGIRENLSELPDVIDLAARIGVAEVYLQRMVFGFSGDGVEFEKALARADESIYDSLYRPQAEAFIGEAERRAKVHGVRFRGADALSPRESIVDR